MNKTRLLGLHEDYLRIFTKVEEIKDIIYDMGWSIGDLPYFVSDAEVRKNEREIYNEIESNVKNLHIKLNEILGK